MRQWFAIRLLDLRYFGYSLTDYAHYLQEKHRRPWNIWSGHRRHFLETSDWMLGSNGFPFFTRIWFRYIFWIGYFAGGFLRLYVSDTKRTVMPACCRLADGLLGGNRHEQFIERRKQVVAWLKEENRKRAETRLKRDEHIFGLRVQHEACQNPNFVGTNRPHQDR